MDTNLKLIQRLPKPAPAQHTLTLPFEQRQKSRFKAALDDGIVVGLLLDRGKILRDGDCISSIEGTVVQIRAAEESVSSVYCSDPLLLSKACYHLGNRHVPLHIETGLFRYQRDHVLDAMICNFGLKVIHEMAVFEPEAGAYHNHGSNNNEPNNSEPNNNGSNHMETHHDKSHRHHAHSHQDSQNKTHEHEHSHSHNHPGEVLSES